MAAPTFGVAGTAPAGPTNSLACNVPVPAGVVANSLVIIPMYVETTQAVTPPAGWVEAPDAPIVVTGTDAQNFHMFWHRATAPESGTYNFTLASGIAFRSAIALRFDGVITSGTPFDTTNVTHWAAKTTTTTAVSPAVSDTTTGPNRLFVWAASDWTPGACTPPGGWTEIFDTGIEFAAAVLSKPTAGSSGSAVGTFATNGSSAAWLGALLPAAAAAPALIVNKQLSAAVRRSSTY